MNKADRDEVYATCIDLKVELTWINEEIPKLKDLIQRAIAAFKYHDVVGNVQELENCNEQLKKFKAGLAYLEQRKGDLERHL